MTVAACCQELGDMYVSSSQRVEFSKYINQTFRFDHQGVEIIISIWVRAVLNPDDFSMFQPLKARKIFQSYFHFMTNVLRRCTVQHFYVETFE